MLKLDMVLFFYDCDLAIAPSSIDGYLFDEWDGFEVRLREPDWQNRGPHSGDLSVGLEVKIDGYQTLDYIYKGLYVCVNDLTKAWGIRDIVTGGMPAYKLYFDPYLVCADPKIFGEEN